MIAAAPATELGRFRLRPLGAFAFRLGDPFEEIAWLYVQRRTDPVERVSREATELQFGVGESVRGGDRESGFPGETVRSPALSREDRGKSEANHGVMCSRGCIIYGIITIAISNMPSYYSKGPVLTGLGDPQRPRSHR